MVTGSFSIVIMVSSILSYGVMIVRIVQWSALSDWIICVISV